MRCTPSCLRSYSPHPVDASFVVAAAIFGFAALRFRSLSNLQIATALVAGVTCAALGALRIFYENAFEDFQSKVALATTMRDWDVIQDPKAELNKCGKSIKRASRIRIQELETAHASEKALGFDQFHRTLWETSENHSGASHFYQYLKSSLYKRLSGVFSVASGSVARTFTTTTDYVGAVARTGASIPGVGPLFSAAGSGFSYAANTSELGYYQKVACLFTDTNDLDFFIRWIALHYTHKCAEHLPYLDKTELTKLAERIAACVFNQLVYKRSNDSDKETGPFNLLNEAKAITQSVDWSSHLDDRFNAKVALHDIIKVIELAKILGLRS